MLKFTGRETSESRKPSHRQALQTFVDRLPRLIVLPAAGKTPDASGGPEKSRTGLLWIGKRCNFQHTRKYLTLVFTLHFIIKRPPPKKIRCCLLSNLRFNSQSATLHSAEQGKRLLTSNSLTKRVWASRARETPGGKANKQRDVEENAGRDDSDAHRIRAADRPAPAADTLSQGLIGLKVPLKGSKLEESFPPYSEVRGEKRTGGGGLLHLLVSEPREGRGKNVTWICPAGLVTHDTRHTQGRHSMRTLPQGHGGPSGVQPTLQPRSSPLSAALQAGENIRPPRPGALGSGAGWTGQPPHWGVRYFKWQIFHPESS